VRDTQRQAVYNWEYRVKQRFPKQNKQLSLPECKALVRRVWNDYFPDEWPPEVRDGRGTKWARGSRHKISLPKWARTKVVVLHEIAHSLQGKTPWHSPGFTTLLVQLWHKYAGIPSNLSMKLGRSPFKGKQSVRFAEAADIRQGDNV